MKRRLVLIGAALALAAGVTAVALGAANNSGSSLDKKQLVLDAHGAHGHGPTMHIAQSPTPL